MVPIVRMVASGLGSLACAVAAGACGDGSSAVATTDAGRADTSVHEASLSEDASVDDATGDVTTAPPIGAPIGAEADTWTWVDFPDSECDDGTPTGIGIYPSGASDNVLVFLNGGGACWDYETCVVLNTSTHGPYGASQFSAVSSGNLAGTILDHTDASNPFADYSDVFIPYCTGDLHAGDAITTYTSDAGSQTLHHEGHANVLAYLARLAATFPTPGQIAVTGSSAGGGGALFNYASFRQYWPSTPMILVDDSLPLLEGDAIPADTRAAWYQSWNLGPLVDPICGEGCRTDLSLYISAIATRYPVDRMALLSSEQDSTIAAYFQLSGSDFQMDLMALAADVLDPLDNFRHFFVTGSSHTMLAAPASFVAAGTPLWTWLAAQATGELTWASSGP